MSGSSGALCDEKKKRGRKKGTKNVKPRRCGRCKMICRGRGVGRKGCERAFENGTMKPCARCRKYNGNEKNKCNGGELGNFCCYFDESGKSIHAAEEVKVGDRGHSRNISAKEHTTNIERNHATKNTEGSDATTKGRDATHTDSVDSRNLSAKDHETNIERNHAIKNTEGSDQLLPWAMSFSIGYCLHLSAILERARAQIHQQREQLEIDQAHLNERLTIFSRQCADLARQRAEIKTSLDSFEIDLKNFPFELH